MPEAGESVADLVAGLTPLYLLAGGWEGSYLSEKVGFISLGCPKNRVDSEFMLGLLEREGLTPVQDPHEADVLVVNTCTFIEQAQSESIRAILEAAQWKEKGRCRALVVTGCLAQRYGQELRREMPEIDVVLGTGRIEELPHLVKEALNGRTAVDVGAPGYTPGLAPRLLSTPPYLGYLKIAEGCDNRCSFCIIPSVRGRYRSRPPEVLVEEAAALAALGVKELVIVAQDVTAYGHDLSPKTSLEDLLRRLDRLDDVRWIRLLYTYPSRLGNSLLDTIASSRRILPYLDLPLQHASAKVLREMRRPGDGESYLRLIEDIRRQLPGVILRSSFIVGFPGEDESDFEELLTFLQQAALDRVGVFIYSPQEGTPAAERSDQVPAKIKEERHRRAMELQQEIARRQNQKRVGQVHDFLIEGTLGGGRLAGRWEGQAPEIDGRTILRLPTKRGRPPTPGTFYSIVITGAGPYDFEAELAGSPAAEAQNSQFGKGSSTQADITER